MKRPLDTVKPQALRKPEAKAAGFASDGLM